MAWPKSHYCCYVGVPENHEAFAIAYGDLGGINNPESAKPLRDLLPANIKTYVDRGD